jgi:hypothetical protein
MPEDLKDTKIMKNLQKMKFIFNAVEDGWSVKKLGEDKIEFKRNVNNIPQEYILNDFISDNLSSKYIDLF